MNNVRVKLVFDRKKVSAPDKYGLIELYVYDSESKKKAYISTGVEVTSTQFKKESGDRGYVIKHPNKTAKNAQHYAKLLGKTVVSGIVDNVLNRDR